MSDPLRFSIDVPALGAVDRSEDLRDPARLLAGWPRAQILMVGAGGRLPIATTRAGVRLAFVDAALLGEAPPDGAVYIGQIAHTDYWAMTDLVPGPTGGGSDTVRSLGPLLGDDEAVLATTAVALLGWHAGAGFCSRCGLRTTPDLSGHSRLCPGGHQEFPRTDPAVIVLVHDGADHAILARQPSWEPGRFSVLAGFAEAGEALESTVAREIFEEVGVQVEDVHYLGSQPWPFPRSLMIAFSARAPGRAPLRPRDGEIEDARWFSRAELAALADGSANGITLPGRVSIARRMVEGFITGSGR